MKIHDRQSYAIQKRFQRIPPWGWLLGGLVILGFLLVIRWYEVGAVPFSFNEGTRVAQPAVPVAETVVVEEEIKDKTFTPAETVEAVKEVVPETPDENRIRLDTVVSQDPLTLDPALAVDTSSLFFIRQMFVGLTSFDEDANVVPDLATDWTVSDDGLEWTFNLRRDINWVQRDPITGEFEDLGPVTAQDVVYGVTRTLDPNTTADYSYAMYVIVGAEELKTANPNAENLEELQNNLGVSAPNDRTVVFRLKAPATYFPSVAGMSVMFPQPRAAIERWGDNWTEAGMIVTNGPYTLQQWTRGVEFWIEKNPLWVNADRVQIELFGGPIVHESSTALAMYENNEIDMMADPGQPPPLPDMDRIRTDAQLSQELLTTPRLCTYYYGFITTIPPFDQPLVRKAFSAAINRTDLIENLIRGGQLPAHSFAPPGIFGNVADDMSIGDYLIQADYAAQVARAQLWLATAGFPEGEGIDLVLGHNTSQTHTQIAQAIQAMWEKAFPKAQITIESQEWPDYLKTLRPDSPDQEKPNIYRMGWCAGYPDQNDWVNEVFSSKSPSNYSKYLNPEFDTLVQQAAFASDPARRQELYRQAEDILINQDAAIAPIFYHTYNRLYKPWLTTVVINPLVGDPVAQWRIDWPAKMAARGQ